MSRLFAATQQRQHDIARRVVAAAMSLSIPGFGHTFVLGQPLRGTIWYAGWWTVLLTGVHHLNITPALLLMVIAGFDAWWVSGSPSSASLQPPAQTIRTTHTSTKEEQR